MSSPIELDLVWYKRDLRVHDHAPLQRASRENPGHRKRLLFLFIIEPEIYGAEDFDPLHARFVAQCLRSLNTELTDRNQHLVITQGNCVEIFEHLRKQCAHLRILSHMETGNALTYARDKALKSWVDSHSNVTWEEFPCNGVQRRLRDRNGWAKTWEKRMGETVLVADTALAPPPSENQLSLKTFHPEQLLKVCPDAQVREPTQSGGIAEADSTLESFLNQRHIGYSRGISSPLTAAQSCSRLSPYLAWGCLSMRQVVKATRSRKNQPVKQTKKSDLRSFLSRCHWRCHFIQKLESEPEIEFRSFNPAYDSVRPQTSDPDRLLAWQTGQTGYPFVDACMRFLRLQGWINFRMRAMLVSFAAYDLWIDWRQFAHFLARQFIDYEPGIHYPQIQMQSGTTGINTLRMYNPIKQGQEQDPEGAFIRKHVPELKAVPQPFIHEPWKLSPIEAQSIGFKPGIHYPNPIVDHKLAVRYARQQFAEIRKRPETREANRAVYERHGSRSGSPQRRIQGQDAAEFSRGTPRNDPRQGLLEL